MADPDQIPRRQLALSLSVSFRLPAEPRLARLDLWLDRILEIPVPPLHGTGRAEAWLWRALLLAREWFQAGRIPVFDLPEIASMTAVPDVPEEWRATVRLALIEYIPHALYCEALNHALRLCAWMASRKPDAPNRETVFTDMENFAAKLMKSAGMGSSTMPVMAVAHRMGIPFLHLGGGIFQLGWGSRARRIDRSVTGGDSAIGSKLCQNKLLTAALLRDGGLPAPSHEAVATPDAALAAARRLGWPVVIKPIAQDGGVGVTIDVTNEAMLRQAFTNAASAGGAVLVERQVRGDSHRLFVAHGALLFALRRRPMGIYGDGVQTVAALTAAEAAAQQCRPPWKRSLIRNLDAESVAAMAKAGFSPDSIPPRGAYVPLRLLESPSSGGLSEDAGGIIHPENAAAALQAAQLLGLCVAGVDLITTDISKPWHETGAIINEVNFSPMLGASDISRRPIPTFLEALLGGNGRIPVHAYVGGEAAWRAATHHWRKLTTSGVAAHLTSGTKTLAPCGKEWPMPFNGIGRRARALALSAQVGAIILAAEPQELQNSPLPFCSLDSLTRVEADPVFFRLDHPARQPWQPETAAV